MKNESKLGIFQNLIDHSKLWDIPIRILEQLKVLLRMPKEIQESSRYKTLKRRCFNVVMTSRRRDNVQMTSL